MSTFLGLEHGEERPVTSLMGLNLAVSTAFVFVQTSAFGLFIEAFGSHTLPYAYFSVAILSSLVAYVYLQVSQRVSFATGLYINLAFLSAMCMVFWLGLRSSAARGFIFLLPFWFQTLVNLANLVVWHLAGHIFHVRQAKRLFGLIVAGNWIANIVGGALVASFLGELVALGSVPAGSHRPGSEHLRVEDGAEQLSGSVHAQPGRADAGVRPNRSSSRAGSPIQPTASSSTHYSGGWPSSSLRTSSFTRWKGSWNPVRHWRVSWAGN